MRDAYHSALGSRLDLSSLLAALMIVPLASGTEMHVILPRAAVGIAMIAMFLLQLRFRAPGLPIRMLALLGLVWLLYGTLSLFWAPSVDDGAKQLVAIALGIIAAIVLAVLLSSSATARRSARKAWVIAFLITAPIAVREIQTDQHRASSVVEHVESGGLDSVTGKFAAVTFGNRNNYVSFLCMVLPAILVELAATSSAIFTMFYFGLAGVVFALVAVDASRLGMITLIGQLLVTSWLIGKNKGLLFKIFVVSLIVVGYCAVEASQFTQSRIESALSGDDLSFEQRIDYSLRGLHLIGDSAGMGVGAGGYTELASDGLLVSAHDVWVEIAANYGIVIAAGFVYLLFLCLTRLQISAFRGKKAGGEFQSDALYAFLLAASLPGLGFINSSCITSPQFWAVMGTVVGIASIAKYAGRGIAAGARQLAELEGCS
jgi:hypothetical protein